MFSLVITRDWCQEDTRIDYPNNERYQILLPKYQSTFFSVNRILATMKEKSVEKKLNYHLTKFLFATCARVQGCKQSFLFFNCNSVSCFIPSIRAEPRLLTNLSFQHKGTKLEILGNSSWYESLSFHCFFLCLLLFLLDWIHAFLHWRRHCIRHRRSGKGFFHLHDLGSNTDIWQQGVIENSFILPPPPF